MHAATLLENLTSQRPKVKYGSAKALSQLGETAPQLLYPQFDFFLALLDGENNILRWNAIRVLACLAPVDTERKLDAALDKYLSFIPGPQMIAAATVIQFASRIAMAKPYLADRIAAAILGVRSAQYKTPECRNVAIGHAIPSLGRFFHLIADKTAVIDFVREQLRNPRPATRKKAEAFLKKHSAIPSRLS